MRNSFCIGGCLAVGVRIIIIFLVLFAWIRFLAIINTGVSFTYAFLSKSHASMLEVATRCMR